MMWKRKWNRLTHGQVSLYVSYHLDANPSTPFETKLLNCLRSRDSILNLAAASFEGWAPNGQYILKVEKRPGLSVNVDDFFTLTNDDHIHIYLQPTVRNPPIAENVGGDVGGAIVGGANVGGAIVGGANVGGANVGENNEGGEHDVNEGDADDIDGEEEERIQPRVNTKGDMPYPYPLPDLKPVLVRKIRQFGRKMDASTKRAIADEIRDDMLLYSNYAYPELHERNRAALSLVTKYTELSDVTEASRGPNTHTTWLTEITRSFQRWRRKNGMSDPTLKALRAKLQIPMARKHAESTSREYNPNARAERRLLHKTPRSIGTEVDLPVDPIVVQEELKESLIEAWREQPQDANKIIDLLNRTATIRRDFCRNPENTLSATLLQFPPLSCPIHLKDDVTRFFHVNISEKIRNFFSPEKCRPTVEILEQSTRTPQALLSAYIMIRDKDNEKVLRDMVLLCLPTLAGRDYTNCWYVVGKAPSGKAPVVRIDSDSVAWSDHRLARYAVHADNARIEIPEASTFMDAVATGLSILYLWDMKIPSNACSSWRFLAEDVCGLPPSAKTKNVGQQALANVFF